MDLKTITNRILSPDPGTRVMQIAITVSTVSHLILIMAVQQVIPVFWKTDELRSYKVELIREAVDDIPVGSLDSTKNEDRLKKVIDTKNDSEETISLDTKDKRYISYTKIIKQKLMEHWGYPAMAKANLLEGKSLIIFRLLNDGSLTGISITESSGYDILDKEVIDAVTSAAPFPPFPPSITVNKLNINASFEYRLTTSSNKK
ncbi:energy transducer TonB [Thermodesulfobacteriota bacterium]